MARAQYVVTGPISIRDVVTRESVRTGGIVTLDTEDKPRDKGTPLAGTIVSALLETGAIKPVEAPKAKAEKA